MSGSNGVDAADLCALFRDLLREFGIDADPARPAAELAGLLARPWAAYRADASARSPLTASGAPFELSVNVDSRGAVTVRYVLDTADRRAGLAANLDRYLDHARATTAAAEPVLDDLFTRLVRTAPAYAPARVMHGVGLSEGGVRRSSLYFPAEWMTPADLRARLPAQAAAIARAYDRLGRPPAESCSVVGYDFAGGVVRRWKTYSWLPVHPPPADPPAGLDAGFGVYRCFAADVPPPLRSHAVFLQLSGDGPAAADGKLFFFTQPWGWSTPDGMVRLLSHLTTAFRTDLAPLMTVRRAAARHGVPLTLALLAMGGSSAAPTITFYFWP